MQGNDVLYTIKEVAEMLKTTKENIYALHKAGLLKCMKLGCLKVRKQTLDDFLAKYDGMDLNDPFNVREVGADDE